MQNQSNDGHYEVLWPRSPMQVQGKSLAKRLDTLNGKIIVQLWDYLFKGDQVFGNTHGADERQILADLPKRLKELKADAVISGMGC